MTNLLSKHARAADGRVLADVRRDEGWEQYKKARDQAFAERWLDAQPPCRPGEPKRTFGETAAG